MPAKRTTLNRRRTPIIDAEALALFVELENMPLPHRQSAKFKLAETELHDDLGLRWEHTFMSASVLDRVFDAHGEKPHERTHDERLRAFEVRQQLLAAAGLSEKVAS